MRIFHLEIASLKMKEEPEGKRGKVTEKKEMVIEVYNFRRRRTNPDKFAYVSNRSVEYNQNQA